MLLEIVIIRLVLLLYSY